MWVGGGSPLITGNPQEVGGRAGRIVQNWLPRPWEASWLSPLELTELAWARLRKVAAQPSAGGVLLRRRSQQAGHPALLWTQEQVLWMLHIPWGAHPGSHLQPRGPGHSCQWGTVLSNPSASCWVKLGRSIRVLPSESGFRLQTCVSPSP